jgi:putative endonuclease
MVYYVYALVSEKFNRIYVGLTKNLDLRIKEHNSGRTKSTKHFKPWKLLYSEEANNLGEARLREKELKTGHGREFLKSLRDKLDTSARSSVE